MAGYNNRSLFSDYYLEELVGEDSHWQALKSKAWEFRQRITNILEKAVPGINGDTPEAEVERRLIRPILDVLGHVYFVQPAVHSPEGIRRPDYAFFSSPEVRQEAESHKGQPEFFRNALAIGDAKAWERSLDKRIKGPGDPFSNHNPSYQIDFYLRATDKRWGLLTNGRHWRVYHRDLSYRLDVYYEVDLPQIITLDENAFLYFLAFFHKEAFQADGTGVCFLDRAYRASTEYAAKVSKELKDNVYEALRLLAEGFLSFPANNLKPENLNLVRENAFIVIYRLLFTLYAEARELLPVTNPTYWGTYSLRALTHEIATKEPFESKLSPTTAMYWSRLKELFNLINSGHDFLHIPPYNGRLFDDQKEHQSLAAWKIGDSYLAGAIDQLARARAAGRTGRGFVSYRDLSIRELGSIYEGLLEHRPRYATQDMAVVREDKREMFIPLAELGSRKALKVYTVGSVYLETDKGERKATGSYYTPDYIVKYIVDSTVGPILDEAKNSDGNLIDSILSLRVLDPAMGSGHFLVEATDFLARALVEALGGDPREMEEDEVRWARREVVERCIYGVDLNSLAVDLAKLSLWLSTVSLDKPLNFLDHHLRCGNSLIGARLEDIGLLPEIGKKGKPTAVTTLAGHQFKSAIASAVSTFHKIAEAPSDSVEDIHRKESAYETARYALSRIKSIADIWTSVYFGNEVKDKDAYERLLSLAEQDSTEWATPGELTWLDEAETIAEERRFFHWELEFPEVFFDRNGQRLQNEGFNAVVGNPPWGSVLSKLEKEYLRVMGTDTQIPNSYVYFIARSLDILKPNCYHSYVVPDSLLIKEYPKTRERFVKECVIRDVVFIRNTGLPADIRPFPEGNHDIVVYVVSLGQLTESLIRVRFIEPPVSDIIAIPVHAQIPQAYFDDPDLDFRFNLLLDEARLKVKEKIEKLSIALSRLCESHEGIHTGNVRHKLFFYHDDAKPATPHLKRLVIGSSHGDLVGRYALDWAGSLVNYDPSVVKVENGEYASLREERIFLEPKLFVVRTGDDFFVVLDKVQFYASNNLFCMLKKHAAPREYSLEYIEAILNSRFAQRYSRTYIAPRFGHLYTETKIKHLDLIPIRRINFTTPKAEREQMVEQSKNLYEEYLQTKDWGSVVSFVAQLLPQKQDGTPNTELEQSDVIHDLLAFLAEELTRLHKEKQEDIKGFLHWLEGYLGVSVEDLKNKTKIKEYWKAEVGWEGFVGALEQNKRAIQSAKGIDVTRREPQENIQGEFDSSIVKLKPLLERMELTDKLIDQIVYKLYGLTEAEIAVVEGRGLG